MSSVKENLEIIRQSLIPYSPKIIAVTKYYGTSKIIEAYEAGIRNFAESKVQDALEKLESLPEHIVKNSTWHFIGHLQSNKVRKIIGKFDYIHSVDSLKLAQDISRIAKELGVTQKVLLQVNFANEETKYGFYEAELKEVFDDIARLKYIKAEGLMAIAPHTPNEVLLKRFFAGIKVLRYNMQNDHNCILPELSMGMSNDYLIAVQEEATMLRLGHILLN
jgi:PLP dependent protein